MGKKWPLTVSRGTVSCENSAGPGVGSVVFTAPDGKKYGVNGTARGSGKYAEIRPIWANDPTMKGLKKDISPLIDQGLSLCH